MTGADRRAAAACPRLAARDSLYTPVQVVELDLAAPDELRSPGGQGPARPGGRVLALVRLHGHPLGLVTTSGTQGHEAGLCRALVAAAHRELAIPATETATETATGSAVETATGPVTAPVTAPAFPKTTATSPAHPCRAGRAGACADPPLISVIVATHDRAGPLRRCLDSVLRNGYPRFEVIVVDNAPSDDAAEHLVRERYRGRVRYLREPVAGLARAHNRALTAAHGTICAFTDDDTLADPDWLAALAAGFAADPRIGCVTGLILPAELETATQAALERLSGFGKGFAPLRWSLADPPPDPLFPFTAGRFGTGANMAFRTSALRGLGAFDRALGTGTPARGGDDLLAFFQVLAAGYTVAYRPEAVIWHHHRRTPEALPAQAFGYGAGFGAFLAAALGAEPGMLPALLRRLPGGLRYAALRLRQRAGQAGGQAQGLGLLELRGLAYGPVGYLRSRAQARRIGG
ncbi:glycosyltransferase [Kitasatospora sp. NBC_01287]|uniref:glycosyltransferase family 2 protein n=1 Tax=Kitasatospora sp. NBC_01287 TaxID=2903573 RepID=UPI002254D44A|nr:glycosyltransferase [Kitasatospora sp. NBC_01287]MCX4749925.1 glycosyltransferase [Kitasatospora sp. NBC_01287]